MGERIAFAVGAIGAVVSGVFVITLRQAFQAAVALIGCLLSVALLFLLLAAPFVAAIQVIVYASAIVVLFLFVIAFLGERQPPLTADRTLVAQPFAWIAIAAVAAEGAVALLDANVVLGRRLQSLGEGRDIGSPTVIGETFLNRQLVPFEATSLVLLVAALGAVMLAKRAVNSAGAR